MTLPDERVNSIKNTRDFLYSLLDPKKTPKVPRKIRMLARACLRHYPGDFYLNDIFNDQHNYEFKVWRKK